MINMFIIIISYLLGSIPVGYLLARASGVSDLRNVGSGGTGATNVMRVGGLKLAGMTWILDMIKSIAATLIGAHFGGVAFGALCGFVSVVGHCYPIWLRFRGGKGISSMLGVALAINPIAAVIVAAEWLVIALATGYSSLGSVIAFATLPIFGFAINTSVGVSFLAIAALCLWRHRQNIKRLLSGTESKIHWRWKK